MSESLDPQPLAFACTPDQLAMHEAARAASFVMDEAAQIHGGNSYMRETEINRLYRTSPY